MSCNSEYCLLFDFDGNLAQTFQSSPQGIGVTEAHNYAVFNVLGPKGLKVYHDELGGLRNRAPTQLVSELLGLDSQGIMVSHAEDFFYDSRKELEGYVPEGLGVPLVWDGSLAIITELLVREKLRYLMAQVGTQFTNGDTWPRPCKGLREFWQVVDNIRNVDGVSISTAVISSGHHHFINQTFETWGLTKPDILVTEDTVRGVKSTLPLALKVKPGPLPLALAYDQWKGQKCLPSNYLLAPFIDSDQMMMFGDDLYKDGGLARSAAIPFGWHTPGVRYGVNRLCEVIRFDDWLQPARRLNNARSDLKRGRPLREAFFTLP